MPPINPIDPVQTDQPTRLTTIARIAARRTTRRAALRQLGGGAALAALGGGVGSGLGSGSGSGADASASAAPVAEAGLTSPFAYRLGASQPLRFDGGLVRAATASEFPALVGMAIRAEEFDPGALQAPHWHPNAGEVHHVISGEGIAAVVSPGGEHASFALRPGGVSFFPRGHYHAIHAVGSEPLRVLAAFTHESPTEFGLGEVLGFFPKPLLAQVLGVPVADFPDLPSPSREPVVPLGSMGDTPPVGSAAAEAEPYTLNLDGLDPVAYEGGTVTNVRGKELSRLDGISFLPLAIAAGGVREPHWHPNAHELLYIASGEAEIHLVGPDGALEMFTVGGGDLAFFPMNWIHSIASVGPDPLDTIVYLGHAAPARIDLSDIVGFMPPAVTAVGLGLDPGALDGLPGRTGVVIAGAGG